jgi:hypothetical protein
VFLTREPRDGMRLIDDREAVRRNPRHLRRHGRDDRPPCPARRP